MRCERKRRRHRRRRAGMTLIEIMLVVVIMAMITAAVGFGVMEQSQRANRRLAETGVRNVATMVEAYLLDRPSADCPTVADLAAAGITRRGSEANDPWGTPYQVLCDGNDINVRSWGRDKAQGTDDDIAVYTED